MGRTLDARGPSAARGSSSGGGGVGVARRHWEALAAQGGVVGGGKSAVDCAVAAVKGGARDVTLLFREAHWPVPRRRGRTGAFFLENADIVMEEAVVMRRLRKCWSQFGEDDSWFVKEPQLPRYHSEPILRL